MQKIRHFHITLGENSHLKCLFTKPPTQHHLYEDTTNYIFHNPSLNYILYNFANILTFSLRTEILFSIIIRLTANITCVLTSLPLPSRSFNKQSATFSLHNEALCLLSGYAVFLQFCEASLFGPNQPPTHIRLCPGSKCHKVNSIVTGEKTDAWRAI